jgi:hypothetical protein
VPSRMRDVGLVQGLEQRETQENNIQLRSNSVPIGPIPNLMLTCASMTLHALQGHKPRPAKDGGSAPKG